MHMWVSGKEMEALKNPLRVLLFRWRNKTLYWRVWEKIKAMSFACVLGYPYPNKCIQTKQSYQNCIEINCLHFAYSLGNFSCYARESLDSSWELLILSETFCFTEKYPDCHETLHIKIF